MLIFCSKGCSNKKKKKSPNLRSLLKLKKPLNYRHLWLYLYAQMFEHFKFWGWVSGLLVSSSLRNGIKKTASKYK